MAFSSIIFEMSQRKPGIVCSKIFYIRYHHTGNFLFLLFLLRNLKSNGLGHRIIRTLNFFHLDKEFKFINKL